MYGDRCGVARALDLVGERWALLVVRELLLGPKRFTDLRAGLPQVARTCSPSGCASSRARGWWRGARSPPPAGARSTSSPRAAPRARARILELGRFGSVAPFPDGDATFGPDALAIALKTLYAPAAPAASIALRLGGQHLPGRATTARRSSSSAGRAEVPDATIEAEPGPLAAVLWHGRDLAEAERAGDVAISGSRRAATRFLTRFPLP